MNFSELLDMKPLTIRTESWAYLSAMESIYSAQGKKWSISEKISLYKNENWFDDKLLDDEKKFEVRTYIDEGLDKYGLNVSIILFEKQPIAWFSCTGKWNDDYDVLVWDQDLFMKAFQYLMSKTTQNEEGDVPNLVNPQDSLPEEIAHYKISDYLNPSFQARFKAGDVVWAFVEADLSHNSKYILVKVDISSVKVNNPLNTYHGYQVNRGWLKLSGEEGMGKLRVHQREIGQGASLCEASVIGLAEDMPEPFISAYNLADETGFVPPEKQFTLEQVNTMLTANNFNIYFFK